MTLATGELYWELTEYPEVLNSSVRETGPISLTYPPAAGFGADVQLSVSPWAHASHTNFYE